MLQKNDEKDGATAVAGKSPTSERGEHVPNEEAVIGQGLKIAGNLECEGDIVVAGAVEGEVTSRGLTVIRDATVKGTIRCETVQVMGEVEGQINASSVRVANTGLVVGDVYYDALGVEHGATIDGQLRRRQPGTGEAKTSNQTTVNAGGQKGEATSRTGNSGSPQRAPYPAPKQAENLPLQGHCFGES